MIRLTLGLAAAGLVAFSASTAAAQNAKVYAIHGIPGGDIGAAPALPVDISVNGGCALSNFQFCQVRGPLSLPAGNYTFEIKLNLGGAPCSGPTAIGPAVIPFGAGETATVIAHITEGGAPTASKFVNDVSRTGAGRARIVAHHTASAPAVDVFVSRDLYDPTAPTVSVPGFINGQQAAAPVDLLVALEIGIQVGEGLAKAANAYQAKEISREEFWDTSDMGEGGHLAGRCAGTYFARKAR